MILIERSFIENDGLEQVDHLNGYTFSAESYAHEFAITRLTRNDAGQLVPKPFAETAAVQLRFLNANDVTQFVGGSVVDGVAHATLAPECYAVPGRFVMAILVTEGGVTTCVFAATAHVYAVDSDQVNVAEGTLRSIDEQLTDLLDGLTAAHWVAVFARNIGDIEGRYQAATDQMEADIDAKTTAMQADVNDAKNEMYETVQLVIDDYADAINQQSEAIDQQTATVNNAINTWESQVTALRNAVEEADLKILNTPNLINRQPEGVSVTIPNGPVVSYTFTLPAEDETAAAQARTYTITDAQITTAFVLHGVKSGDYSVVGLGHCSLTAGSGTATLTVAARSGAHDAVAVTVYICAVQYATLPYGEISRWLASDAPYLDSFANAEFRGDERDEVSERVVTLAEPIVDSDEAVYNTAVAFTVASVPQHGYNNQDRLVFNHGHDGGTREEDGQTVTYPPIGQLDMIDGAEYTMSCWARVTAGSGARLCFSYGIDGYGNRYYVKDVTEQFIDINNTTWKRFYWTFTYRAQINGVNFRPRIGFGVCRAFAGTVQLCGFRLTAGGLYGNNTVDTIRLQLAALENRVAALEALTLENSGN